MVASDIVFERRVASAGVAWQRRRARGRARGGKGLALSSARAACAHSEAQRAPQQPYGTHRLSLKSAGGGAGGEGPKARVCSRYLALRTRGLHTGTGYAEPADAVRQACGGLRVANDVAKNVRPTRMKGCSRPGGRC